jgi:hypothetical protein
MVRLAHGQSINDFGGLKAEDNVTYAVTNSGRFGSLLVAEQERVKGGGLILGWGKRM